MIESILTEMSGAKETRELAPPPYFSYSQASSFQLCPRAYFYHYILKLPSPRGAALGFGSSIDAAISYAHEEALLRVGKPTVSLDSIQNMFISEWDQRESLTVDWDHEEKYGNPGVEHYRKIGPPLLKEYYPVYERTVPRLVQAKVEAEPATGIIPSWQGYLDVVATGDEIIDIKTSSKKYSDSQHPRNSLQLLCYRYFYDLKVREVHDLHVRGNIPKVHFHVLVKTKTPQVQVISHQFTASEIARGIGALNSIYDSIRMMMDALPKGETERGVGPTLGHTFPPCDRGSWKCSEKWCGFYERCHNDLKEIAETTCF